MRLIDADALKAEFTGNFGRELWHYTGIWAIIGIAPTIDAAPVVRCRACKYRADATEKENYLCNRKMLGLVRPDDFCSFGERKEGEG